MTERHCRNGFKKPKVEAIRQADDKRARSVFRQVRLREHAILLIVRHDLRWPMSRRLAERAREPLKVNDISAT